jgi:glycosyltransferase involved in cell wall biosynthesis
MRRFASLMLRSLTARGIAASLITPQPFFGSLKPSGNGFGKWLGYLDKFVVFPFQLRRAVRAAREESRAGGSGEKARLVVHICDHSNAMYSGWLPGVPLVITCHDLLAVRGALGEATDCPASFTGVLLQRWILRGLARAGAIVCISSATRTDVERLVSNGAEKARLAFLGLNHSYKVLAPEERERRLAQFPRLHKPFLLHVGSNERRKNRAGVLRIFHKVSSRWDGCLVFAGEAIPPGLRQLARDLGISERVVEIVQPGGELLEAIYNQAFALLFPSTFEGFGWPIIEAQASGCPVVCSNSGPFPEVVGEGGLTRDVTDEDGLASSVLQLTDPEQRDRIVQQGLENVRRFTTERMMDQYNAVYRELTCR